MLTIKAFVRLPRCLGLMKLNKFCFARAIREKKIEKQQDTSQENNNFQDEINNTKSLQKEIPTISTKNEYKQEKKVENKTESNKYNKKNIIEKDIESFETLIKSFNDCKQNFDMIFFLKFLNDAIKSKKLRVSKAKRDIDIKKNIYIDLLKIPEINECISVLKMNITEMENIQITNFLSLLSKIDYYDAELFAYISNRVVKKEINLNTVASSFLIWTLAKYKIKNDEMLEILTQNMLNHPIKLNVQSMANIFWSLSVLNYRKNEELITKLEDLIIKNAREFDSTCVNLIFGAYCNNKAPNFNVLDALSTRILDLSKDFTFRNIANWLNYCATLNYSNLNCFNLMEVVLTKKIKAFEQSQEMKDVKILQKLEEEITNQIKKESESKNIDVEDVKKQEFDVKSVNECLNKIDLDTKNKPSEDDVLTPFDASQILLSFCKLKVIKPELFELLEAIFIKMFPIANPSSFTAFAFAHSSLCTEMQMKFFENKKYLLRRSVKNLKKYNQMFYELMLPYIKLRLPEFKFEDIYSILLSASRPLVKKRAVCRELIDLGLSGMPLMKNNLEKLPQENFEKMSFQYYRVLINFVFKKEQKVLIEKSFTTMNIDITKICARYGYLIPQSKEIELIEDDVNENDEENDTKIEENNK